MESLRYLPLTSSKVLDWVALIGPTGDVVGHAPVDGFWYAACCVFVAKRLHFWYGLHRQAS